MHERRIDGGAAHPAAWKAGLFLVGAAALVVAGWPSAAGDAPEPDVRETPARQVAASEERRAPPAAAALADLAGRVAAEPLSAPVAEAANAKKIAKLLKKIAKLEHKVAVKEAKVAAAEAAITDWQAALADAQAALEAAEALPEDTPEQIAAKKKALELAQKAFNKASKKLVKLGKKVDTLQGKIAAHEELIVVLGELVAELTPGGFPDLGPLGLAGLEVPRSMHVVAAGGSGSEGQAAAEGLPDFPPDSDYVTDEARVFVYDPSMETLDSVNGILCLMQQTAYEQMVNAGPYNAQIDNALCGTGENGGQGGGAPDQSTGTTADLEIWVVNSVRTDEASEHVVGVWIPNDEHHDDDGGGGAEDGGGFDSIINVRIEVVEGVSEQNPFGVFHMDFIAFPLEGSDPDDPVFWGTLASQPALDGFMGFTFFQERGDPEDSDYERVSAHVNMLTDGTQGVARIHRFRREDHGTGPVENEVEYVLAFDPGHVLRAKDGGDEACLSRTEFDTNVWRYALYHAEGELAGQEVDRNAGFGFTTADGKHGWADYWGMWLPNDAQVQTGDAVTKATYGDPDGAPEPYTVLVAPGKLVRNTRSTLALAQADGMRFDYWEGNPFGPPLMFQVEYDAQGDAWWKVAEWVQDVPGGPGAFVPLDAPVQVDTEAVQWLDLWSDALGGPVSYVHGDDVLTYFVQQLVNGNDPLFAGGESVALYGYLDVLAGDILGSEAQAGQVFLPNVYDPGSPYALLFSRDDLGLYHDEEGDGSVLVPVGLADGETYSGGQFGWGLQTGPLVADVSGLSSVFDVFAQDEFYVWETGPNPHNRYQTLVDGNGAFVEFDPPITFTYTHSTGNDVDGKDAYDGRTYQFRYYGPGDLQGIPFTPVDLDADGHPDRWYPDFSIADGTLLGPTGTEYVLRAIEREETLQPDPGGCGALDIAVVGNLPLPDGSTFEQPNIGDMPALSDPPAVVAGEVVGGGGGGDP